MSKEALAWLWTTVGTTLSVYAVGTWILTQGVSPFEDVPGLDARAPVMSAYFAVVIIGALLAITSAVGLAHAAWAGYGEAALPLVGIEGRGTIDPRTWSVVVYQAAFLILFTLIPLASLGHLSKVVFQRGVLWNDAQPAFAAIAVENAYALTAGKDAAARMELTCAAAVTAPQGRVWLAERRCDPAAFEQIKPGDAVVPGVAAESRANNIAEKAAWRKAKGYAALEACTIVITEARGRENTCARPIDVSRLCAEEPTRCRGVEWLPVASPLLMAFFGGAGVAMTLWLYGALAWRRWM